MKDLVKKVAVGLSTGALVAQGMILPAFADLTVVVEGNGSHTDNTVNVAQETTTQVNQTNTANVSNNVSATSNTGNNGADDNTGGDVSIDTGDAKALVEVQNTLNSNEASVDCGGCNPDVNVKVSGNGTGSDNDVNLGLSNSTWVVQDNNADVENDVEVKANSGKNYADDNTGGDVDIDTGEATALAVVKTMANANVAHVGGEGEGALELWVTGNGSWSDTTLNIGLENETGIDQSNWANIENDVEVDANSGKNDANDNTGGSVAVDTGDAWAGASVDTQANFNMAHVEDCCEFDGLVKVAGNGKGSDQEVNLDLASALYATQDNAYTCGDEGDWFSKYFGGWNDDCAVDADANSGRNDADDNTGHPGDDPSIDTGDASTEVEVSHTANSNVFHTGDALPELPDWEWDGNVNAWMWWFMGHSN